MKRQKREGFKRLKEALSEVLSRMRLWDKIDEYRAVAEWSDIVGEGIARHASAVAIENKTLVVAVDSHSWMTQLLFMKRQLLNKIAVKIGAGVIEDIRFILKREVSS